MEFIMQINEKELVKSNAGSYVFEITNGNENNTVEFVKE